MPLIARWQVHLFLNLAEAQAALQGWVRILGYLGMLYLFLSNPSLAMMLMFGYNMMMRG